MGAGDEFIVTGQVRDMQNLDPRRVRIEYEKPRWHPIWDHNPRIAHRDEKGDFQILHPRSGGLRPYCVAKDAARWRWRAWGPPVGEMYFSNAERSFGKIHSGHVVLEPHIKPSASPNKRWPWDRWRALVIKLASVGIRPVQLGPLGTKTIDGAKLIETSNLRAAAAVLANSRAAVLTEGALHHIAAGVGTPAVVIFGGFISPAVTGYLSQQNLFTGEGLGCGCRQPCKCCAAAMEKITPELVMGRLLETLEGR